MLLYGTWQVAYAASNSPGCCPQQQLLRWQSYWLLYACHTPNAEQDEFKISQQRSRGGRLHKAAAGGTSTAHAGQAVGGWHPNCWRMHPTQAAKLRQQHCVGLHHSCEGIDVLT